MMLFNYFTIAARNFGKRKVYSLINATGLSIAIAFSLLVFFFIADEQSFDQFHSRKDRVYRINIRHIDGMALQNNERELYNYSAYLPNALGAEIREQLREADHVTLLRNGGDRPMRYNDKALEQAISFTDSSFFHMFSFPVLAGNTHDVLKDPTDAVITPQVAARFFGDENPIGKTFYLDYEQLTSPAFTVRAVVDCPANSSLQFQVLLSLESYRAYLSKAWNINSYPTFVQLRADADAANFLQTLNRFVEQYRADWVRGQREYYNIPADMAVMEFTLTPLDDIHFDKKVAWTKASDPMYSWILGSMALLIIFIASINYISFALASSASRRKEIGIRKTIGATGNQIFSQFNIESISLCTAATAVGLVLALLSLPLFNSFTQKEIRIENMNLWLAGAFLLSVSLLTGLLAGSYPSLFVSRIKPVLALRGSSMQQPLFIRPLVVLQFFLSAFLIVSSVIMYRQMNFVATKDLGYSDEHVISVQTNLGWSPASDRAIERYRAATAGNTHILEVSGISGSFIRGGLSKTFKIGEREHLVYIARVDPHYFSLLNIPVIEGRNFMPSGDSLSVIVNEALVRDMGWSEPLQELYYPDGAENPGYRVVGVVSDYHFLSLEEEIKPMMLSASPSTDSYLITLLVKLNGADLPASLASAERAWKDLYPDKPFEYAFADVQVARQYETYQRWTNIAATSSILAIIIAGLGMFGLSGISAAARTKEIGIRKVLGADLRSIFLLINKPYLVMSVIAFVIAAPLSWYVMRDWISNFKYHVTISWEIFVIGALAGLVVALISVSYHGIRTAQINPADTLRGD